jgi:secondary thiamine-phosphate synthase enzyme
MDIFQKSFRLKPRSRGIHLITQEILSHIDEIKDFRAGLCQIFIQHTSASLAINENADPDVRSDFESFLTRTVPENTALYRHTLEGADDMTSHIKNSIIGSSLSIPITDGRLNLGVWQGIYLCEHRNNARGRNIVLTIIGEK